MKMCYIISKVCGKNAPVMTDKRMAVSLLRFFFSNTAAIVFFSYFCDYLLKTIS